jgi:hypothetical protein
VDDELEKDFEGNSRGKYYPGICLEEVRKTTKHFSQDNRSLGKFSRASQVSGILSQTFYASRIMEVATHFEVKHVEIFITCVKILRANPRHLTRVKELASCKRRLSDSADQLALTRNLLYALGIRKK